MSEDNEFVIGLYVGTGLICIISFVIYIMRHYTCEELMNKDEYLC